MSGTERDQDDDGKRRDEVLKRMLATKPAPKPSDKKRNKSLAQRPLGGKKNRDGQEVK